MNTNISIPQNSSIQAALVNIDDNALGMTFVVDENNMLLGVVTDGDIRRGLIHGRSVEDSVNDIMNTEVVSLNVNAENRDILSLLNDRIKVIPLVNEAGELVDYASPSKLKRIALASPKFDEKELENVVQCVKTGWVSSQGSFVREFEAQFRDYCGQPTALAVSNGTVALHLALVALGIKEGDEVLVPDLTFAASANSVIYCGAKPVLVDVYAHSMMIDIEQAESLITDKTKAIMPVHLYGQVADMDSILKLAEKHDLLVIEDCAEALGSTYKGQRVGSFGDAAGFSFFGNKIITTGEGGMVVFKSEETGNHAAVLRDHGMDKSKRYWHNFVGFNYRMTNIQAALGVAQMEKLDYFVEAKRRIASHYDNAFKDVAQIQTPFISSEVKNCYWMYNILLTDSCKVSRDEVLEQLTNAGIECRPVFYPLSAMPVYQDCVRVDMKHSVHLSAVGISLPSAPTLDTPELDFVVENVLRIVHG